MYLGHVKFYKAYKDESLTVASLVRTTEVVSTYYLRCYIYCSLKVSIWQLFLLYDLCSRALERAVMVSRHQTTLSVGAEKRVWTTIVSCSTTHQTLVGVDLYKGNQTLVSARRVLSILKARGCRIKGLAMPDHA